MISVSIPMKLPSAANLREHYMVRARRMKAQRNAVLVAMRAHEKTKREWPIERWRDGHVITLTRIAARKLDDDNLASAFKAVRDEVAAWLGIDDGDARLTWHYQQAKAKWPGIKIEIQAVQPMEEAKP